MKISSPDYLHFLTGLRNSTTQIVKEVTIKFDFFSINGDGSPALYTMISFKVIHVILIERIIRLP